jgi:HK97 family phage prohead protease
MKQFTTKSVDSNIIDIDATTRKVKAVWSTTEIMDLDNDIIASGAFTKSINERGPGGKNLIWSLIDHRADIKHTIGKPEELYVQGNQLIAVTPIIKTEAGEDALKLYEAGVANQHSIGFSTIISDYNQETHIRIIKELKLYEGSLVLWGANPETPTLSVKGMQPEEAKEKVTKRLDLLYKAFKNGKFTDDTFSLIEIEIEQLKKAIIDISAQPVKAVEPDNSKLIEAIKSFNNTLKK